MGDKWYNIFYKKIYENWSARCFLGDREVYSWIVILKIVILIVILKR